MIYELHITVADHDRIDDWVTLCDRLEIKPLFIELVGGTPTNDRQLMFAAVFEGDEGAMCEWHAGIMTEVLLENFNVVRDKLEVPLDKSSELEPEYHETHVKCLVTPEQASRNLVAAEQAGWVASRNILRPEDDGLEKWYFTKRDYTGTFLDAGNAFRQNFAAISPMFRGTVRMEMETVIADTNAELDKGWA